MAERKVTTKAELLRLIDQAADEGWTKLNLSGLGLEELPPEIGKLRQLEILILGTRSNPRPHKPANKQITQKGHSASNRKNSITEIPSTILKLENLQRLNLRENPLRRFPQDIVNIKSLKDLDLNSTWLEVIPYSICKLENLETLDIGNNRIFYLPTSIKLLEQLRSLALYGNPMDIPAEVLVQHLKVKYVLGYLQSTGKILSTNDSIKAEQVIEERLDRSEVVSPSEKHFYLNPNLAQSKELLEAKFLLVGQGSVGKTSLINRLLNDTFDHNESQTDGLAVHDWQIHVNSKDIRLNVWDFGGQEIYHATHQFFLTKRSLYLLVCNCRTSEEENRLEYWLKLIQSFGGSSPVIIVGNKNDEQPLDINQRALRDKYPNIKAILETSCQSGDGIDELKQAIEKEVGQLKEVYDLLPLKWFEVKEQLEAMDQDFIKYSQYERLCEDQDIPEDHNQEQLIRLLHDLGLVLNYRDHPILSNTNVLNPDWVTAGIYALFSDDELKTKTKGILHPKDLSRILDTKRYPQNRHSFLIELLKEFQLGFELPNCPSEKKFLLPGLLPKEEPQNTSLDGETLEFHYHYKVLPASVLSRFIVLMHEKIYKQTYWRSGVMLAYREGDETFNIARIKADIEDKKVFISVSGRESTRRIFLSLIRDKFAEIHSAFADPDDVTEWVPVPEHPEADPLEYKELLGLEDMGDSTVTIGKLKLRLDLRQLLDGYEPREQRQQRQQRGGGDNSVNITIQQGGGDNVGGDNIDGNKIDQQHNY